MEESVINQRFQPNLRKPFFIEGLPGFGNIGKITAKLLSHYVEAKCFAEYYSPFFPDFVSVSSDGICRLPHYEFYASSNEKLSVVLLTGESQPLVDNIVANYEICEEILDFAQKQGCSLIVTLGGLPVSSDKKNVYIAATSNELAVEIMEKGGIIYGGGRIMGVTGLLLGLAKERGLDGICLLGSTNGLYPDNKAGAAVYELLLKVLKSKNQ